VELVPSAKGVNLRVRTLGPQGAERNVVTSVGIIYLIICAKDFFITNDFKNLWRHLICQLEDNFSIAVFKKMSKCFTVKKVLLLVSG